MGSAALWSGVAGYSDGVTGLNTPLVIGQVLQVSGSAIDTQGSTQLVDGYSDGPKTQVPAGFYAWVHF